MESISHWDKQGGNTCVQRWRDSEIVAERFKASTKKINQKLADAIVSVQTGCRACHEQNLLAIGPNVFFEYRVLINKLIK